ncbi:putative microtubule-associated protein VP10, partial [Tai Forest reovirus]
LRRPVKYNIFLLPTARKLAQKLKLFGKLDRLPPEDWRSWGALESKLKWLINTYPSNWREKISAHERGGMKFAIQVEKGSDVDSAKSTIRKLMAQYGKRINDLQFVGVDDLKNRYKKGKIVLSVSERIDESAEGILMKWREANQDQFGKYMGEMLKPKMLVTDFINPQAGCRYPNVDALSELIPEDSSWLFQAQAGWQMTYGHLRPLEIGMKEDFFASSCDIWCVRPFSIYPKYEGLPQNFSGALAVLPTNLLTDPEVKLQSELMSKAKGSSKDNIVFCFSYLSFTFRSDEALSTMKKLGLPLAEKEVYTVLVPKSVIPPLGPISGERFAKDVLSRAVGAVNTKSKIAMTFASGLNPDVTVLCETGCGTFIDGTNPRMMAEILSEPARMIILGRKGGGKSRLGALFSELGYNVIDSDSYGRLLYMCGADMNEEKFLEMIDVYLRMTKKERDSVPSYFEVEMDKMLQHYTEWLGLPHYLSREHDSYGRLDRALFHSFDKIYDSALRKVSPEFMRLNYTKRLWEGVGFDDNGIPSTGRERYVCFCHTLIEQFQGMSATMFELIPSHSTRVAISLRGQGTSLNSELYLHDYYVAKNGNGCTKVGLGWLVYMLEQKMKE